MADEPVQAQPNTPVGAPQSPPAGQTHQVPHPSIPPGGSPVTEPPVEPVVQPGTQEPAQQTAAPAPVQAPAPAQAPPLTPPQTPDPVQAEPVAYDPIGNVALDAAAKIVQEAGFNPIALSNELYQTGRLSDTTVQALEQKLGAEQVALLTTTYHAEIKKEQDAAEARNQEVYKVVGGKETWDALAQWTTTPEAGLSPEAADEYNAMLAAGGVQAKLAARALKEAYMASPGFKENTPNTMVQGDDPAPTGHTIEPISRLQYVDEKRKAIRSGDATKVAQLEARAQYTLKHAAAQWRLRPLQS